MDQTILVVDDEPDAVALVRYHLQRSGFAVWTAADGPAALRVARQKRPDAIILDVMLPQMSGTEVLRLLRQEPDTAAVPVLMLTARAEATDRVEGLQLGADDYVTKPFSPREVVLRTQNLVRRSQAGQTATLVKVGEFCLDKGDFEATVNGKRLELTAIEFKLLSVLVERRGRVLSRETLLRDVWKYDHAIDTRTVDTHVRRLREKLGSAASHLVTVRGEGYGFALHAGG
ncbi:MAG: response regulator transcription factor [Verrucomicrobia bacterium]|nr:response regulator transcription factor [Verrucomicrobiota bacterium]